MKTIPFTQQSIGRDAAIRLFETKWWIGKSHSEIANFQFFTAELCMPFDLFHAAIEKTLGRPIWTHEFALHRDQIAAELRGEKGAPTMQEILDLIPADKRIVITK